MLCLSQLLFGFSGRMREDTRYYWMTNADVVNPYIGFAPDADSPVEAVEQSLVYIEVSFAELQPHGPDSFDFDFIEKKFQLQRWKDMGKHAVLRFNCDVPGEEPHMDIPQWLYDLTGGDGDHYDTEYGYGYAPDYSNPVFIKHHRKALLALGEYFSDGFVSYVQLGSLGHWGEWHVHFEEGIRRLPNQKIRGKYVKHYLEAFPNTHLLMRRPFEEAREYGLGLYNDSTGNQEATDEWLDWIENGGRYDQTRERKALVPMPDAWQTAPIGGELTSSRSMDQQCIWEGWRTIAMLEASHTSFLGPYCPISSESGEYDSPMYRAAAASLRKSMGYRYGVTRLRLQPSEDGVMVELLWCNDGVAPIYFETPVKLLLIDEDGEATSVVQVEVDLRTLLPDQEIISRTLLPASLDTQGKTLAIGIYDPYYDTPSIKLVSSQEMREDGHSPAVDYN